MAKACAKNQKAPSLGSKLLIGLLNVYRLAISPILGPRCRYYPSCSNYAIDSINCHGAIKGGFLAVKRLARCHPFGGSGYDPVPTELTATTSNKV